MPNYSNSQVSDLADSLPSEPHDIRNWFSSYAYESPELNTYENCDDSALRASDSLDEAVYDGERGKQEGENKAERTTRNKDRLVLDDVDSNKTTKYKDTSQDCGHTKAIEGLGSLSDCLSLSPEPPHVQRRFSSYVYESPLLDTDIDFSVCESQCIKFDGAECSGEKCCEKIESNLGNPRSVSERNILLTAEKVFPHGLATCSNFVKDRNSPLHCIDEAINAVALSRSDPIALPNKKSCKHILNVKPTQDHNITLAQVRNRVLDGEDFISREPLNNASSGKSETPDILAEKSGKLRGPAHAENLVNLTSGSVDKENKGNGFQENGFVSTRKERSGITNGAISLKRLVEVPSDVSTECFPKRKPFSERTNFQHSDGLEITGKWKCPRKSKPNLGPPLKQLRLEQWVNRM